MHRRAREILERELAVQRELRSTMGEAYALAVHGAVAVQQLVGAAADLVRPRTRAQTRAMDAHDAAGRPPRGLRRLRPGDFRVMTWKNGLGTTTELAVDPPGASLDDFGWRVSIAELRASGPFSAFPGCERLILQLDGAPVTLRHDDGVVHPLAPLAPYRFSGERPTFGALGAGPARDFNVITRRARWSATLEVVHLAPGQEATVAVPAAALVHAHRGNCAVTFDDASRDLADGDAAIAHGDGVLTLAAGAQHALVLAVALRAMPAEHRA